MLYDEIIVIFSICLTLSSESVKILFFIEKKLCFIVNNFKYKISMCVLN